MRQYRLFICFFMLCLFSDLTAQNILVKGTVMERTEHGELIPLIGATVMTKGGIR